MTLLLTKADLRDYTRISQNVDDFVINPAIRDAHTFDVLPQLREAEVGNLVAYLALPADERGQQPAHTLYTTAVRPLLCYHTYRRYLLDAGVSLTASGPEVLATDINRQPISQALRLTMRADAEAKCAHYQGVLVSALATYRGSTGTSCHPSTRRPRSGGYQAHAI